MGDERCSVVFFPHTLYVVWSTARKDMMAVYHLQKVSGKSGWKVTGTRLFGSFRWIIPGDGGSEKVVLLYRWECSKQKFVFHFLPRHLWYQLQTFAAVFFGKCKWLVKMANSIPEWNLLVFSFAYHLPKPRADRFAHVNGKQPLFLFIFSLEWKLRAKRSISAGRSKWLPTKQDERATYVTKA